MDKEIRCWKDAEDGPVKFTAEREFVFIATLYGQPIYCDRKNEVRLRALLLDGKVPPFDKPANTYDPETHVAVRTRVAGHWEDFLRGKGYGPSVPQIVMALRDAGLVKPDPTPIERFMAAHPAADRETAEMVLAWKGEQ